MNVTFVYNQIKKHSLFLLENNDTDKITFKGFKGILIAPSLNKMTILTDCGHWLDVLDWKV